MTQASKNDDNDEVTHEDAVYIAITTKMSTRTPTVTMTMIRVVDDVDKLKTMKATKVMELSKTTDGDVTHYRIA